jgi:hypothetical protein
MLVSAVLEIGTKHPRGQIWLVSIVTAGSMFARLITHQPSVLFSQNKPVTSNQPAVLFSQNKPAPAISHQPTEHAAGFGYV